MGVPRFNPAVETNYRALPTFTPNAPNAVAGLMDDAGRILGGITNIVTEQAAQRAEAEALEMGQIEGGQPGFDPKRLAEQQWTVAGQAYRKGAMQTYMAQLEMGRDEAYNKILTEYEQLPFEERGPEVLTGKFQTWMEGTLSSLPENLQFPFRTMATTKANPLIMQATRLHFAEGEDRRRASDKALLENLREQAIRNPLPATDEEEDALNTVMAQAGTLIGSMDYLTPEERRALASDFQNAQVEPRVMAMFEGATDKVAFVEQFAKDGWQGFGIDSARASEITNLMQTRYSDLTWADKIRGDELSFADQMALAYERSSMQDRVDSGEATEEEIMRHALTTKDPDWAGRQLFALRDARARQAEELEEGFLLANGDVPFDPTNSKNVSALEKMVERIENPSRYPVEGATLTSKFGPRKPPTEGASADHPGIDIGGRPVGAEIHTKVSGKVKDAGVKKGYGHYIDILQDDGYTVRYGHNSANLVKKGDVVKAGQIIGKVGNEGISTGPHTHIEVRDGTGKLVNPDKYFQDFQANDQGPAAVRKIILSAKFVPKTWVGVIQSGLFRSDKPELQREAFDRYAFLVDNAIPDRRLDERAEGILAAAYADAQVGVPVPEAIKQAIEQAKPNNQPMVLQIKAQAKEILKKPEYQARKLFEAGWFGMDTPEIPVSGAIQANLDKDLATLFENFLGTTNGHQAGAWNLTKQELRKMYGVTRVGGRRQLVKYPPEVYYGFESRAGQVSDADTQWIQKQLFEDLRGKTMPAVEKGKVLLVTNPQSARGGKPSYLIFMQNAQGEFAPIMDGQGWRPDSQKEQKRRQAEIKRLKEQGVKDARLLREKPFQFKPFNMTGK